MIGICGGSASGKTTVANKIISELGVPWVTLLSMDSFYKVREDAKKLINQEGRGGVRGCPLRKNNFKNFFFLCSR